MKYCILEGTNKDKQADKRLDGKSSAVVLRSVPNHCLSPSASELRELLS